MISFRSEDMVSLWVYCQRHDEYDQPDPNVPSFDDLFKPGYVDDDCYEADGGEDWESIEIAELIGRLSYSESFLEAALEGAKELGVTEGRRIIALYDFAYIPEAVGVTLPEDPVFLGAFSYDDSIDEEIINRYLSK